MSGYVCVLLFVTGVSGHPVHAVVECPDLACVHELQTHSGSLARLRVWAKADFAMMPVGKQFVWPPFIDEQYQ